MSLVAIKRELPRFLAPLIRFPTWYLSAYSKQTEGDWSERALRDDLSKLVRLGDMVKQGQGKSTFYVRTEKPTA